MELVQIMENDSKKTSKASKLKEWFVAREAQMAQLSLDGDEMRKGHRVMTL